VPGRLGGLRAHSGKTVYVECALKNKCHKTGTRDLRVEAAAAATGGGTGETGEKAISGQCVRYTVPALNDYDNNKRRAMACRSVVRARENPDNRRVGKTRLTDRIDLATAMAYNITTAVII